MSASVDSVSICSVYISFIHCTEAICPKMLYVVIGACVNMLMLHSYIIIMENAIPCT